MTLSTSRVRLVTIATALALVATALLPLQPSPVAAAGPFVVDTTADTVDASPGNGACADSGGFCSLRAAVQETNALAGADTITVPAGTYPLTRAGRSENAGATGDLDITGPVTITGIGAPTATVGGLDRIFEVRAGGILTVEGVTLSGGDPGLAAGGGILANPGTSLTLTDATVDDNTAFLGGGIVGLGAVTINGGAITNNTAGKDGGGIFVLGTGALAVTGTTIAGNTAARYAAGILTLRGATLTDVTIENNTAAAAGGLYAGGTGTLVVTGSLITGNTASQANALAGGLLTELATTVDRTRVSYNDADIGGGALALNTFTLTDSTIDHNNADVAVAGIGAVGPALDITNTTISANTTAGFAGGLGVATTATLTNTTIADNIATTGGSGIYTLAPGEAGTPGGTTTLTSTILGPQTVGPDCGGGGTTTSTGDNIASDATCNLTGAGDQPSTDSLLGALADNGGPTPTHLPYATSPALDAITAGVNGCGTTLTTDQRATERPQSTGCEVGAVEALSVMSGVGAGQNFLGTGNDPGGAIPGALHENQFLAISGPCASAENGDGLQAITDGNYWMDTVPHDTNPGAPGSSISWQGCQATNSEDTTDGTPGDLYDPDGYFYAVDVPVAAGGNDLYIDIWDPADCEKSTAGSDEYTTTYTLRGPDTDSREPTNNPVLDTLAFPSNSTVLVGGAAACEVSGADWEDEWRNLLTVTDVDPGTYFVQVQTAGGIAPTTNHGSNSFSLRASYSDTWSEASSPCSQVPGDPTYYDPTCPAIRALEWLGTLNTVTGTAPSFWAAAPTSLPPGGTLVIDVFDPGEGALGLEVLDPLGRSVEFDWEVIDRSGADVTPTGGFSGTVTQAGGIPCTTPHPGCEELDLLGTPNTNYAPTNANYWRGWNPQMLPYRGSRSKYSDRLLRLTVPLPADPVADYGGETRFRIRYTMGDVAGANTDRTMWRASVHEAPSGP